MARIEYFDYPEDDFRFYGDEEIYPSVSDITETLRWGKNLYNENIYINNEQGHCMMHVTITPGFVRFIDDKNSSITCGMNRVPYFSLIDFDGATQFPESLLDPNSAVVCLLFKTKEQDRHHSHLRAGHIFDAQFTYLLQNGPIDAVIGRWDEDLHYRTNYDMYNNSMETLFGDSSLSDENKKERAAFSTWTGKKLQPFGFKRAFVKESFDKRDNKILALFTR